MGHLGYFQLLASTDKATVNMVEHVSLWHGGASFGYIPKSGIAGFSGRSMSNFLKNLQIDFQNGYNSLQFHQQWRSVLSPHRHQHVLIMFAFFDFSTEALRAMSFLLHTAFIMSYKFGCVVPSFSLNSKVFNISLSLLMKLSWSYSASTCILPFCCFCCYWGSALVCGVLIEYMGLLQCSFICWVLFCVWLYGWFLRMYHEVWEEGISFVFGWNVVL